jgi:hypothetical protein
MSNTQEQFQNEVLISMVVDQIAMTHRKDKLLLVAMKLMWLKDPEEIVLADGTPITISTELGRAIALRLFSRVASFK